MMDFYKVTNTSSHYEFEQKLRLMVTDEVERLKFYEAMKTEGADENNDLFMNYFEQYSAERKTNKQDYTPRAVAELMDYLSTPRETKSVYDGAAGTGSLLIAKWTNLKKDTDVVYYATEFADNAIPYLIHNLCFRNMNAEIKQGDTISQEIKNVWVLKRTEEGYSKIEIQT